MTSRRAQPAEDVFHGEHDVAKALDLGFPRVAVVERGVQGGGVARLIQGRGADIPVLELAPLDLPGLRYSASTIPIQRIDTAPPRMRQLINEAALPVDWVEGLLRDLGRVAGHALPSELSALGRRTLEFPSRYGRLDDVAGAVGMTSGVLKAHFRRRALPSPFCLHNAAMRALRQRTAVSARNDHSSGRIPAGLL